jgi:hypothetical protein
VKRLVRSREIDWQKMALEGEWNIQPGDGSKRRKVERDDKYKYEEANEGADYRRTVSRPANPKYFS